MLIYTQSIVGDKFSYQKQTYWRTGWLFMGIFGTNLGICDIKLRNKSLYYIPSINFLLFCSEIILVSLRSEIFH